MKKLKLGIILGILAGIIDVIPMIIQKLTWDANLSAFTFWIVVGLVISIADIKIKGALKGVILSLTLFIPIAVMVAWQEPMSLIPIIICNLILGSLLGWSLNKFGK